MSEWKLNTEYRLLLPIICYKVIYNNKILWFVITDN